MPLVMPFSSKNKSEGKKKILKKTLFCKWHFFIAEKQNGRIVIAKQSRVCLHAHLLDLSVKALAFGSRISLYSFAPSTFDYSNFKLAPTTKST